TSLELDTSGESAATAAPLPQTSSATPSKRTMKSNVLAIISHLIVLISCDGTWADRVVPVDVRQCECYTPAGRGEIACRGTVKFFDPGETNGWGPSLRNLQWVSAFSRAMGAPLHRCSRDAAGLRTLLCYAAMSSAFTGQSHRAALDLFLS